MLLHRSLSNNNCGESIGVEDNVVVVIAHKCNQLCFWYWISNKRKYTYYRCLHSIFISSGVVSTLYPHSMINPHLLFKINLPSANRKLRYRCAPFWKLLHVLWFDIGVSIVDELAAHVLVEVYGVVGLFKEIIHTIICS